VVSGAALSYLGPVRPDRGKSRTLFDDACACVSTPAYHPRRSCGSFVSGSVLLSEALVELRAESVLPVFL
jgi:hypothetical protein